MPNRLIIFTLCTFLSVSVGIAAEPHKNWDIILGATAQFSKVYEGSDGYRLEPLPYFHVLWHDMIELDPEGINAFLIGNEKANAGVGLTYDWGRQQKNIHALYGSRHPQSLQGLGNIDPSLGLKAFANYTIRKIEFGLEAVQYTGNQNDGLLFNFSAERSYHYRKRWIFTPSISTDYGDDCYMQAYFGVTPTQASRSQFQAYDVGAGFKDVTIGLNSIYQWNPHWFVATDLSVQKLVGDAATSPITRSDIDPGITLTIGYHF